MANCAMMNIPPSEAKRLSYWEYHALLWNWNDAHELKDDVEAPDVERTMALIDQINANPDLTGTRPEPVN